MWKKLLFVCLLGVAGSANAYTFKPTDEEFESWSLKCKALYLSTQVGARSRFLDRVPQSIVNRERRAADLIHSGGWHYCAGLIYLRRAKREVVDDVKRAAILDKALAEVIFSASDVSRDSYEFLEMNVTLGNVYKEMEDYQNAEAVYDRVIQQKPSYLPAYAAKSLMFRKQGELDKAVAILEAIPVDVREASAEVNYFLGLFTFELGQFEKAKQYAKIAYDLGYPLPGLKNKLASLKSE